MASYNSTKQFVRRNVVIPTTLALGLSSSSVQRDDNTDSVEDLRARTEQADAEQVQQQQKYALDANKAVAMQQENKMLEKQQEEKQAAEDQGEKKTGTIDDTPIRARFLNDTFLIKFAGSTYGASTIIWANICLFTGGNFLIKKIIPVVPAIKWENMPMEFHRIKGILPDSFLILLVLMFDAIVILTMIVLGIFIRDKIMARYDTRLLIWIFT